MIAASHKAAFYNKIREAHFKGQIRQPQVEGIEAFITEFNNRGLTDRRQLSYILATVYHETAGTMQPIEEYGKGKGLPYGKKLKMGGGPGKRVPYTKPDKIYYGRGHTQNTWYENYQMLTREAQKQGKGWDFLNHPELLLQMEPSVWATFHAMLNGLYTGRGLQRYFNEERCDWLNARKIINGLDKADRIAGIALKFNDCLA